MLFTSNLEKLNSIYEWYKSQDSYDVFCKWNYLHTKADKKKQKIVDKNIAKAAALTKKLTSSGNKEAFQLLEDKSHNTPFFPSSWTQRFGRFVSKGFLKRENDFYSLLEDIYLQNPECCLNLAGCVIDERLGEKNYSTEFRNNCYSFIDRIIEDFVNKNEILVGTAYGIKLIWNSDEKIKEDSYSHLLCLAKSNQRIHPEEVIRWLQMLLFYSHKHNKDDLGEVLGSFEECLNGLSEQQVYDHMHPNIIQPFEVVKNSTETEQAVLDAMRKAETIQDNKVLIGYTHLALQKSKSETFLNSCLERLDAMLSKKLLEDADEAAKMISLIGQASKHKGREDEFPKTIKLVKPFLEKIHNKSPSSIAHAKVIYGSHGTGSFQHPKYVEIYQEFVTSKQ